MISSIFGTIFSLPLPHHHGQAHLRVKRRMSVFVLCLRMRLGMSQRSFNSYGKVFRKSTRQLRKTIKKKPSVATLFILFITLSRDLAAFCSGTTFFPQPFNCHINAHKRTILALLRECVATVVKRFRKCSSKVKCCLAAR